MDPASPPEPGDRLPTLGPRGEGWVALQLVGLGAVLAGLFLGPSLTGPARLGAAALGALLTLAGAAQGAIALLRLGPNLTPNPRPKDSAQLVEVGIYALARHPIYGALVLGSVGVALLAASLPSLLAAAATSFVLWLKSWREEAWLVRRYPGYRAYRARTRRFLALPRGPG